MPLYEAKMFWHFDHRFGSYEQVRDRNSTHLPTPSLLRYMNSNYVVQPWYWVSEQKVYEKFPSKNKWFVAFRDVTNSTNERTGVFSLIPLSGINHKAPVVIQNNMDTIHCCIFLANVNSMPFDYLLRKKMGGTSLGYFILKQLPIYGPKNYDSNLIDQIAPKTIELVYTAWDLKPFAEDILVEIGPEKWNEWFPENTLVDGVPQPFKWDEERRLQLRCELDAVYAHLYGISKDDLDFILGTFPIVKRKDEVKYGTYRTKDLILEYYDQRECIFGEGGTT